MSKRNKPQVQLKLPFWREQAGSYFADLAGLKDAIVLSGKTDDELESRLLVGFSHLETLRNSGGANKWSAHFVETALLSEREREPSHSAPP